MLRTHSDWQQVCAANLLDAGIVLGIGVLQRTGSSLCSLHCPRSGLNKEIGTDECDVSTNEARVPTSNWRLGRGLVKQKERHLG